MIGANTFILANLALYVLILVGILIAERRSRRWTTRWHRNVRTRRISTEEVRRMIERAAKRERSRQSGNSTLT